MNETGSTSDHAKGYESSSGDGIVDLPSDSVLEGMVQVAADICEAPAALISLTACNRRWIAARGSFQAWQPSQELAFCASAMQRPADLMEVDDVSQDPRFNDNHLVLQSSLIQFYAGKPLLTSDNLVLGTLCVVDDKPRSLSVAQRISLRRLAGVVTDLLEERQRTLFVGIDVVVEQNPLAGLMLTDPLVSDNPDAGVNGVVEHLTGNSKDELIVRKYLILKSTGIDAAVLASSCEPIVELKPGSESLHRKEGRTYSNQMAVLPVVDCEGNAIRLIGIQQNASDEYATLAQTGKAALLAVEDDLNQARASRNRLAQIVEDSANEIFIVNAVTLEILDVNRAARDNLGYTLDELRQMRPGQFVEGLVETAIEQFVAPLRDGRLKTQSLEAVHLRKDGSSYLVAVQLQMMATQNPPVFTVIAQDITDKKHQEEINRLRDRAIEAVDVGISITDASKKNLPLVYVNQALCEMTGYSYDELLGQNVTFLQMHDQHQAQYHKLLEAQAEQRPVRVLLRSVRKDGTQFMRDLSVSPVHNQLGELTHYIGISHDVTERLDTEARLHQAQKIEAIGQLAGGIAHDFNNVLSVIAVNVEFVAFGSSDESHQESLAEAITAVKMGARLTRRLLSFGKHGVLEPVVLNVNEHVRSAIDLLRSTLGGTIALYSRLLPDLWSIYADSSEIENTVVNLVINARDAMPGGGNITVKTGNISFTADDIREDLPMLPGDYVRLVVKDDGSGMTEKVQAHIFEPFYTTKEDGRGTGLGLASIHSFVQQSGGHIQVLSEVGRGTTIELYIPRYLSSGRDKDSTSERSE